MTRLQVIACANVPHLLWTMSSLSELRLVEVVSLRLSLDLLSKVGEEEVVPSSQVRNGKTRAARLGRLVCIPLARPSVAVRQLSTAELCLGRPCLQNGPHNKAKNSFLTLRCM